MSSSPELNRIEVEMDQDKSLNGVISYLARKCGGNVHENGIVRITSMCIFNSVLSSVAEFGGRPRQVHCGFRGLNVLNDSGFQSCDGNNECLCWDFHEKRVRPFDYRIGTDGWSLTSWVVEGSLDGEVWTELDRQRSNRDTPKSNPNGSTASFAVRNPTTCRLIRVTQLARRDGYIECR